MVKNLPTTIHAPADNTSTLPSFQTLREGVYWRAISEIDLGNDWVQNEKGISSRQQIIIPSGQVLLLLQLHFVDDEIHAVTLHHHPSDSNGKHHKFLVKDFLDTFEPAYDAEIVRAKELTDIQQQITDIQTELASGPQDEVIISGLLEDKQLDEEVGLSNVSLDGDTPIGSLITQSGSRALQVETIQRQIRNQQVIIKAKADWMTSKTTILTKTVAKMAPFFAEKSAASLASCQEALTQHGKILKSVANLELYTLKDVEIQQLCAGESASPSDKISIFQRKLFLDEETLIHQSYGGADYSSFSEFAKELNESQELRNRLIPCSRGVVAVQWRRHAKAYDKNPIINAMMNAPNFAGALLVRDGDNFFHIFSPLVTESLSRMFPTKKEMDDTFKNHRGEDITFGNIDFANAKNRHDDVALHYRRLLLLLWGLQDGRQIFGALELEKQFGQLNWFSYSVQNQLLHLIYDDERSTLLGELMPPVQRWVEERNSFIQGGSRVFALHHAIMNAKTCPGAVRTERWGGENHDHFIAQSDHETGTHIVYQKADQFMVDIPCNSYVYSRGRRDGHDRKFNAACNLSVFNNDRSAFYGYLCLDNVDPEHIDYYLNSREDRQYYLRYINLFQNIKEMLLKEREKESAFVSQCEEALLTGDIVTPGTKIIPLIRDVIRNYRAANRGANLPCIGAPGYQACFTTILNTLYILVDGGYDRVSEIERILAAEGRRPIRYVVNGLGKIKVYASLLIEEQEYGLGECPWVMSIRLEEKKTKIAIASRGFVLLPEFSPGEIIVKEWEESADFAGKPSPYGCTYEEAKLIMNLMKQAPDLVNKWFKTHDDYMFDGILESVIGSIESVSSKNVGRTQITIPIMMPIFQRDSSKDSFRHQSQSNYPTEHYLLYWEADSLQMLYAFATKTQQKRIETSLGDIYQRPKTHIDDLRETTERRDFGKLFLSKITKNVANACFGEPCVSKLNGCRAKLEHAYDFTTPADRITLFLKELLQSPTLRTFETIGFIPLCNEANSVLNKICEHDTKEEDANKYRYSEHISANLLPT